MYEEEMRYTIAKLLQEKSTDEALEEAVSDIFGRALESSKKAGVSLESVVYEIMEGVEAGLEDSNRFSESYLNHASELIVATIHKEGMKRLACEEHKMHAAQHRFNEVLALESSYLKDSMESFRQYAVDKHHGILLTQLDRLEMKTASILRKMAERFGYNKYISLHKKRTSHYDC